MPSGATTVFQLLEGDLKNQPKQLIVLTLKEIGTVESLAEVKVILTKQASESHRKLP